VPEEGATKEKTKKRRKIIRGLKGNWNSKLFSKKTFLMRFKMSGLVSPTFSGWVVEFFSTPPRDTRRLVYIYTQYLVDDVYILYHYQVGRSDSPLQLVSHFSRGYWKALLAFFFFFLSRRPSLGSPFRRVPSSAVAFHFNWNRLFFLVEHLSSSNISRCFSPEEDLAPHRLWPLL
jgi:hypothetical protein